MEMILVDWTRMGRTYCIAGLVSEGQGWRTVRPMPVASRGGAGRPRLWGVVDALLAGPPKPRPSQPPANIGWSSGQLGMLQRWDIVELVGPKQAEAEPPHVEDIWVQALYTTGKSVPLESRATILRETCVHEFKPYFGVPLEQTHTSAFLRPGTGERSLVTVIAPSYDLHFEASRREGADEADVRVRLKLPGVGVKLLPVKDHYLLCQAERAAGLDPAQLAKALRQAVDEMGNNVAVRLGLSRGFDAGRGERRCWLMADGFFPAEELPSTCR
jgi:hypothetical protein